MRLFVKLLTHVMVFDIIMGLENIKNVFKKKMVAFHTLQYIFKLSSNWFVQIYIYIKKCYFVSELIVYYFEHSFFLLEMVLKLYWRSFNFLPGWIFCVHINNLLSRYKLVHLPQFNSFMLSVRRMEDPTVFRVCCSERITSLYNIAVWGSSNY